MRIFKKGIFSFLFIFIFFLLGCGFFWWRWATGAIAPEIKNQKLKIKNDEKIFVVKRGESITSVGERLRQEGLIRSPLAFKILVTKEGLGKKIQAGDFRLSPGMILLEIAQELTHGTLDIWVTIPEGWRAEEVVRELDKKLATLRTQNFTDDTEIFRGHEGYLFPDTYLIPKEATPGAIIKIFLKNFEKKFDEELRQEAAKQGLTVKQVLILASLVEREAKHDEDRPIVAGILLKRWQKNWPLQADATVQYAVATSHFSPLTSHPQFEWWPKKLTKQDLKIVSPYNTYQNRGLPPTPICNPGLASIKAVIRPRRTDYWYYLSDSQGQMHYAETDEEHTENIVRYLR